MQEIDIATGLVLFEWHSLGNIGLSESHAPGPRHGGEWDYVHANSVALDADGDFIVSARLTSAVYKISRRTGKILWRLGGTRSDFRWGGEGAFWQQHDARPQPDGTLTLFDKAVPPRRKHSRAITTRARHGAQGRRRCGQALTHPTGLLVGTQGGVQALPNGNTFVGWGSQRYFTEYDAAGKVVLDGRFAARWRQLPGVPLRVVGAAEPPAGTRGSRDGDRVAARVSWNGATGVAAWELWAGGGRPRWSGSRASAERRVRDRDLGAHRRALRRGQGARRRRGRAGSRRADADRWVRALTRGFPPAGFRTIAPRR